MSNRNEVFTLRNANGMEVKVTNFGARVMSMLVPAKDGTLVDVVLGYDTPEEYKARNNHIGAAIGRYANRIANAKFTLDGHAYQLVANNNSNSLHGGLGGFHNVDWTVQKVTERSITLTYMSPDGEEGFPGNLKVVMTYRLDDDNAFGINYQANTDKATVVNLTNHSFFNLNGAGNGNILNHILQINAKYFTPVNELLIPTGNLQPVAETPLDFTSPKTIGAEIDAEFEQLAKGKGYDHNWVLDKSAPGALDLAASVRSPLTGIAMQVWTTAPGLQFYSSNYLDGSIMGKENRYYAYRGALCLEAQHFPDSPNHLQFPSTILRPRETYNQTCIYKFSLHNNE